MEDSLYSGGCEGHGQPQVALHCATFQPSDGFHHVAFIKRSLEDRARTYAAGLEFDLDDFMPYVGFVEADGGHYHNVLHLKNKIAAVALFLACPFD